MDFIERELDIKKHGTVLSNSAIIPKTPSPSLDDFQTAQEYIDHYGIDDPDIIAAVRARKS